MSNKEDKILTRVTFKLISKEGQQHDFKPQHRSTQIQGELDSPLDPFAHSPRIGRSPERTKTQQVSRETSRDRQETSGSGTHYKGLTKSSILQKKIPLATEGNEEQTTSSNISTKKNVSYKYEYHNCRKLGKPKNTCGFKIFISHVWEMPYNL